MILIMFGDFSKNELGFRFDHVNYKQERIELSCLRINVNYSVN